MPETGASRAWVSISRPMIDQARGASRFPSAPQQSLKARSWPLIPARPFPTRRSSSAAGERRLGGRFAMRFRSDAQGRFEVNPSAGNYFHVTAYPTNGEPYLSPSVEFAWTKGAVRKHLDIPLPRGVLIRGKVTERGSSTPLSGATVQFQSMNPRGRNPAV